MVGNGVMDFTDHSLEKSSAEYMFQHSLISNRLEAIYSNACSRDYRSPRCRFVQFEIGLIEAYLNRYSTSSLMQISTRLARGLLLRHFDSRSCFPTNALKEKMDSFLPKRNLWAKSPTVPPTWVPSDTGT